MGRSVRHRTQFDEEPRFRVTVRGNIKVRDDGTVKILDFGLAKLTESTAPSGATASPLSQSPTITIPATTMAGVILGTAAYMAPEQASGKPADRRADIWSFGAVLYEMLTGKRAFEVNLRRTRSPAC